MAFAAEAVEIDLRQFDLEVFRLRDGGAWHVEQIHDTVALTAFEMRMEGGIAVKADFRVLYFHGLDKIFCKQQFQCIVNGCTGKSWIFWSESVENCVNRWMNMVVAKEMENGDTRA